MLESNGYKWNFETKNLEKVLGEDKTFKNGDIIVSALGNIAVFSHTENNNKGNNIVYYHCLYSQGPAYRFKACVDCGIGYVEDCRFATEHERELMMEAIRKHGFYWNSETKTLEKLVVPKFKVGDIVQDKDNYKVKITEVNIEDELYGYESLIAHGIGGFSFNEQDNWELVPNKFDISTLKPFDKVLVRDHNNCVWDIDFFGFIDKNQQYEYRCCGCSFKHCIPYNEETKHLLGTNKQAPEFYVLKD